VVFAIMVFAVAAIDTRGQFYAPQTERHDPVQRLYVIELARTLAWFENLRHPGITEVSYEITTKADQSTQWDIRWLEKSGQARLRAKIEYPADLLEKGIEFYRKVGADLTHQDWQRRFHANTKADAIASFWTGAAQMGLSREESIGAALEIADTFETRVDDAIPELAGILTHAAVLSVTDRMTLDNMLAARAAAWLYIAERAASDELNGLWAPVLFLAGREKLAGAIWKQNYPAEIPKATPQQAGWNIWLRRPTSREVYLFATDAQNLAMGLPMMASDSVANETTGLLVEAIGLAVPRKDLARIHNFGPRLSRSSVGGGRIAEGYFAVTQRLTLAALLGHYKPGAGDFLGYTNELAKANAFKTPTKISDQDEGSLFGLAEFAPLIKVGRIEGAGALAPTAVATSRDLLNYAWEMTGSQMGSRYRFVKYFWGVPDLAERILKESTRLVEGVMPFFLREAEAKTFNYRETLARLELVDGLQLHAGWSPNPFADASEKSANLFVKRHWLRPQQMDWQLRSLWDNDDFKGIGELLAYYRENSGPIAASYALSYSVEVMQNRESRKKFPEIANLAKSFEPLVAQPGPIYARAMGYQELDHFDRAVKYEELYWKNPDAGLESMIFRNYLLAGAFKSARRFYAQSRDNLDDPITVSNGLGLLAYASGVLRKDPLLCQWAIEDSFCGSYRDMTLQIWEAARKDNRGELKQNVVELIERYESDEPNGAGARLSNFLHLLPSLADPAGKRHAEALRYFGKSPDWIFLRWMWIDQFKLPKEEAIEFLGGRESDQLRRALVSYYDKDRVAMLDALNKFNASENRVDERTALIYYLYEQISTHTFNREEKDLKPAESNSVRTLLHKKFKTPDHRA